MLEIPTWVPPSVAAIAREMHGSLDTRVPQLKGLADVIERLACESRMRRVWQELKKKHRSGPNRGSYVNSAQRDAIEAHPFFVSAGNFTANLSLDDKVQNKAFVILFRELVTLTSWDRGGPGPRTRTVREAGREVQELRSAARRIQAEAKRLRPLRIAHLSSVLEKAAAQCLEVADLKQKLDNKDVLIVARNRSRISDQWERGFVISAAHLLEYLFGQKMHGLVAALADVALGRSDITESQVKGMFRRG